MRPSSPANNSARTDCVRGKLPMTCVGNKGKAFMGIVSSQFIASKSARSQSVLTHLAPFKHGLDCSKIEHLLPTGGVTCRPERTYSVRDGGCIGGHWPHRSHRYRGHYANCVRSNRHW